MYFYKVLLTLLTTSSMGVIADEFSVHYQSASGWGCPQTATDVWKAINAFVINGVSDPISLGSRNCAGKKTLWFQGRTKDGMMHNMVKAGGCNDGKKNKGMPGNSASIDTEFLSDMIKHPICVSINNKDKEGGITFVIGDTKDKVENHYCGDGWEPNASMTKKYDTCDCEFGTFDYDIQDPTGSGPDDPPM